MNYRLLGFLSLLVGITGLFSACNSKSENEKLPVFGRNKIIEKQVNGNTTFDTLEHKIADFRFVNQDSAWVTNSTFKDKIYVADFFFTSCPTICPKMKKQMLRVYDKFKNESRISILSHTIDPNHDTVELLKKFSDGLGVKSNKWHFVTGDIDDIYTIGEKSYMVTAGEDEDAPGGYIHSGAFLLIDNHRRVRGVYDGTEPDQVSRLLFEIDLLLNELDLYTQTK